MFERMIEDQRDDNEIIDVKNQETKIDVLSRTMFFVFLVRLCGCVDVTGSPKRFPAMRSWVVKEEGFELQYCTHRTPYTSKQPALTLSHYLFHL